VRFYHDAPATLDGSDRSLSVVAGGRALLPAVMVPWFALPEGFAPLVRWRLTPAGGARGWGAAVAHQTVRLP
jgi:hypothetical protein